MKFLPTDVLYKQDNESTFIFPQYIDWGAFFQCMSFSIFAIHFNHYAKVYRPYCMYLMHSSVGYQRKSKEKETTKVEDILCLASPGSQGQQQSTSRTLSFVLLLLLLWENANAFSYSSFETNVLSSNTNVSSCASIRV